MFDMVENIRNEGGFSQNNQKIIWECKELMALWASLSVR